jgi:hypothetical protein
MKKLTFSLMLLAASAFTFNASAQDDFTKGSGYHLIYLDAVSGAKIPASKITKDYRTDDVNNFLYIWENTYTAGTASGPNWNGEVGEFLNFSVNSVGWSGFGFASSAAAPKDMSAVTADYTLHIAFKATNAATHCIIMDGPAGLSGKAAIGATPFADNGKTYPAYANFTRDNKWHLIEIPMSYFFAQGLRYPEPFSGNVFALLSGGVAGTSVSMDAIFVYKKSGTGVNDIAEEKLNVLVTNKTLTVIGATQPIVLYSVTGAKVKTSKEAIMGIEDVQKGIYIIRCGNLSSKVQLK